MHKNPAERIFLEDIPRVHKREMEEFMDGFYLVLWLFFLYSFAGWFLETGFSILLKKRMINRGVLNGPLCTIYGVTALIISIGFSELQQPMVLSLPGMRNYFYTCRMVCRTFFRKDQS